MSKSGSFTLVLTVICLSVLMSLETDAQSTTDETNSCSASSLEEVVNLVEIIASKPEDNAKEIKNQKEEMKMIASTQQQNAEEVKDNFKDVKDLLSGNSTVLAEIANMVRGTASNQENNKLEPSKQALVSALEGE